ncbi:MAG TPA: hypothetical protein VGM56_28065, partial [Byssovorax sp.]
MTSPRRRGSAARAKTLPPAPPPLYRVIRLRAALMGMASEAFRPLALGLKQAMLLGYLSNAENEPSASDFGRATETNSA